LTDEDGNVEEPGYRVPGRQPPPPRKRQEQPAAEQETKLRVDLQPRAVRIEPGGGGTVALRVRNTSPVVDEIHIEISGEAAAWAAVVPSELRLYPGTDGDAVISFHPPRAPQPTAGPHEVRIAVSSSQRPAAGVEASIRLDIAPFDDLTASLSPRHGTTKGEFSTAVRVANQGNRAVAARISAGDPQHGLDFTIAPEQLSVVPGGDATAWLRMRPVRSSLFGRLRTFPFDVTVNPVPGSPRTLDGRLDVPATLPGWVGLAGALVLLLAIAGGVACGTGMIDCLPAGNGQQTTDPTITPQVTAPSTTTPPTVPATTPGTVTPTPAQNLVTVPELTGLPLNEALVRLQDLGLRGFPREVAGTGQETFAVIRTEPAAGTQVQPRSDVLVFFAFGR